MKRKLKYTLSVCAMLIVLVGCSISYSFDGASINYDKTKTIQISDFPIRASYVWGPMASIFNNALKDKYADHTKLTQVKRNGDWQISGEITEYSQRNKSVSAEGYSAQTELTMAVTVTFVNKADDTKSFSSKRFSASASYETTQNLNSVQETLVTQMAEDIVDQIYNATAATW